MASLSRKETKSMVAPGYFARQDTRTPVRVGIIALVANLVLNLALVVPLAHAGLALATSLAAFINAGLLYRGLRLGGHHRPRPGWGAFVAAREIEYEVRNDLFSHLLRLPQSFFFRWRTGDIMSRCVNDVNALRLMMGVGVLNVVQTPILYAGSFCAMAFLNWRLALLVVAGGAIYGLCLAAAGVRPRHLRAHAGSPG